MNRTYELSYELRNFLFVRTFLRKVWWIRPQYNVAQTNSARAQCSPPPCSAPVPLYPDDVSTPWHKHTPWELSAPRHARTRVPNISPLTRGNQGLFSKTSILLEIRQSQSPSQRSESCTFDRSFQCDNNCTPSIIYTITSCNMILILNP